MDPAQRATLERACAEIPGLGLAVLFGSEARGTAGSGSDIDVAIEGAQVDRFDAAWRLSNALGREVEVVTLDDPGVPLLEELVRDGTPLHEAQPGAFARWRSRALTTLETDRPGFARMREAYLARLRGGERGSG